MKKKVYLLRFITEFYIIIGLWGMMKTKNESNEGFYLITVVYFLLFIICLSGNKFKCCMDIMSLIPLMMIGVWCYGCIFGIIHGNNIRYVLRNFSGMLLYILVYFFNSANIKIERINKLLLRLSVCLSILTPIAYFFLFVIPDQRGWFVLKIPFLNAFATGIELTGFAVVYSGTHCLLTISYGYCLYQCINRDKYINKYLLFAVFDILVAVAFGKSGGLELEILMMTGVMIFFPFLKKITSKKTILLILGITAFILFINRVGLKPLLSIFDPGDEGNSTRYGQINYIFNNLSIFGHGLGAEYIAIKKGYGIEFIYGDLLYKFGIFGVIPIVIYFYTLIKSIKILAKSHGDWSDIIPFALMGYTFYALGNPVLFSGSSVISHILALIYIKEKEKQNNHERSMRKCIEYQYSTRSV